MIRKGGRVRGIREVLKRTACCLMSAGLIITAMLTGMLFDNVMTVKAADLIYTEGNSTYKYSVNADDTVTIKKYSGTDTEITVPAEIDGKRVTAISSLAFFCAESLKTMKISSGVVSIGDWAFQGCTNLETIEILSGVTELGIGLFSACVSLKTIPTEITEVTDWMFSGCEGLIDVVIPEGIKSIGENAFSDCTNLVNIVLPVGLEIIKDEAFEECNSLKYIELSNGLISMGSSVFSGCTELTKIALPKSLSSVYGSTFSNCSNLNEITVAAENNYYKSIEGCLYDKEEKILIRCPEGKEKIEISNSINAISGGAFENCKRLTELKLPANITKIEGATFFGCSSLMSIKIPSGVTYIGPHAFDGCVQMMSVEIPESVNMIETKAFVNCMNLKLVKIFSDEVEMSPYVYMGYIYNDEKHEYEKIDGFTITARAGSTAETYAKENDFKFIELKEMSSSDDIHVEYEEPSLPEDVTLQTKVLTESDEAYGEINLEDKLIDSSVSPEDVKFSAYDISLVNSLNQKVQPNGSLTVKMPVPTGYDGSRCKVYRVNKDGSFTDMEAVCVGTYMIFETNHFSTYMITETELESNKASDVVYGDANSDGTVNSKDVVMIKKHLAGYTDLGINIDVCDVNVDGTVNSKDAVLILKKLAGYDVELGK